MINAGLLTGAPIPPGVVKWFKVYCGFLCVLYLCVAASSLIFFLVPPGELDLSASGARIMGAAFLGMGFLLFRACALPFVVKPRPWVWGYGIGLICLGMTSACFSPACVPLMFFWLKPGGEEIFWQELILHHRLDQALIPSRDPDFSTRSRSEWDAMRCI